MIPLPIDSVLPQIIAAVRASRGAVIVAPPGAGKTTRVPPPSWQPNFFRTNTLIW